MHEDAENSGAATRWSLVFAAGGDATGRDRALQELCGLYWSSVYAWFRRAGHPHEVAEDLTQGLFARLLEREDFGTAHPDRGRFRVWLRTCARNFAANELAAGRAAKRGGGAVESLDRLGADRGSGWEPLVTDTPEQAFERQFAMTVVAVALERLEAEFAARGRDAMFAALRCYLESGGGPGFAASATTLGLSEGAVKVAVHRMRARFRVLLVAEVRETLMDAGDVEDEVAVLLAALGG